MPAELKSLDRLGPTLREPVLRYAEAIQRLAGANALGLTLHGAIAAGSFRPDRHLIQNVLLLESVDLDVLKRLAEELPQHHPARIAPPLVLSPAHIRAALDTFPLELIEIQQQHWTLFGRDYFESLAFEAVHVRLQCERELKTMLLAMRQALLLSEGRDEKITRLTQHAGDGVLRTLRGLLWLRGHTSAQPAAHVVSMIEEAIPRPLPGVRELLDDASSRDWQHFRKLYADLDALANLSDDWSRLAQPNIH